VVVSRYARSRRTDALRRRFYHGGIAVFFTQAMLDRMPAKVREAQIVRLAIDEELRLCDCANCGKPMVGESHKKLWQVQSQMALKAGIPHPVAGRVNERPYCVVCFRKINTPVAESA
jgi:hypothetical protein